MTHTFKARKMRPGWDTISIMAMHYGLTPQMVRDVIRRSGAEVIREDGHRGRLVLCDTKNAVVSNRSLRSTKVVGWEDGHLGVDPNTTKLTKKAIMAVARWKFQLDSRMLETSS